MPRREAPAWEVGGTGFSCPSMFQEACVPGLLSLMSQVVVSVQAVDVGGARDEAESSNTEGPIQW
jgi:hypothetical protein